MDQSRVKKRISSDLDKEIDASTGRELKSVLSSPVVDR